MPLLARHPLRIQPFFGHRTRHRLLLSARALGAPPSLFEPGSRLGTVRTMLEQLISHEMPDVPVRLELAGKHGRRVEHEGVSDAEGYVHFDIALESGWDLPDRPTWEAGRIHWRNEHGPQSEEVHILAPGHSSALAIISDIDDTIIETGVTGGLSSVLRNWKRLFAQLPHERLPVAGADTFFRALAGEAVHDTGDGLPAPQRPFFYISSSPWNLYAYLVAFKRAQGLPLGPLKLRDWGLDRRTLGKGSHGAHKNGAIDALLEMYPQLRFALVGDDTQGDLPAFARAVELYPGRIAAVFLRTVSSQALSLEERSAQAAIEEAGVPLWLGKDYRAGLGFLHELGLASGELPNTG